MKNLGDPFQVLLPPAYFIAEYHSLFLVEKDDNCNHARKQYDREKVRQFMKNKREKEIAIKKEKEQNQEKAKLLMKDRLMALELKAISAASKVIINLRLV